MKPGTAVSTPTRGSFRSQWDRVSRVAPGEANRFRESAAPWLNLQSINTFAQYLQSNPARPQFDALPPVKRAFLVELATNFHKRAGTFTPSVASSLDDYIHSAPSLRIAHQPNFLPSVNVAGQAAVCASMSKLMKPNPVQIFLIVDYDVNTDRRYRHALLPSLSSHTGYASLCAPPLRKGEEILIFGEQKPSEEYLLELMQTLHEHTAHDLAAIRQTCGVTESNRHKLTGRQTAIAEHLLFSLRHGATLADVNSIFLSRVTNLLLDLPTIFIPGSLALRAVTEHLQYLWSVSRLYDHACQQVASELADIGIEISSSLVPAGDAAPFWGACPRDSSRIRMQWTDKQQTKATGKCGRCATTLVVTSRNIDDLLHGQDRAALLPRVVWDDLLDGVAWGHLGGCSYRGGLEHYMFTTAVAQRLGFSPLPEFLSEYKPRGDQNEFERAAQQLQDCASRNSRNDREKQAAHMAGKLARSGRASFAYSLLWKPNINASELAHSFHGTP